jgi:hypothetical protein
MSQDGSKHEEIFKTPEMNIDVCIMITALFHYQSLQ